MSKNYTNYSNKQCESVEEPVVNEGVIEKPAVGEQVVEEKKTFEKPVMEEQPAPAKLIGSVNNCKKLNVRKTPNAQVKNVITTIPNGTTVTILGETNEFYEISTKTGIKGYCMKKYIDVK